MALIVSRLQKRTKRLVEDSVAANQPKAALEEPGAQLFSEAELLESPDAQVHRYGWVKSGELVSSAEFSSAWGLTRQAIGAAVSRGELFAVRLNHRLFYPAVFLKMERDQVAQVCRALGTMTDSEKFVFWTRSHGALAGKPVLEALKAGIPLKRVVQLAHAWARERGVELGDASAA